MTPALSRRGALISLPLLATCAAQPALAAEHPDAELVRLCQRFPAIKAAATAPHPSPAAEAAANLDYLEALGRILRFRPASAAGWRAKASAVVVEATEAGGRELLDGDAAQMAFDLVRDGLRLFGRT